MNTFEIKKGYFTIWDGKTKYDYHVGHIHNYDDVPEPEYIYELAIDKGLPEEEIIDLMLKFIHKKRIAKIGYFVNSNICIALIGPRGSGKSVGATQIGVVDGLLAGRKVISNMPIQIKVKYKDAEKIFETENLDMVTMLDFNDFDTNYQDCWILIDETNVSIADSQRTMSNQSLFFSHVLQQMRHRKLDFIFTTQSEMFLPYRARFQTDIIIKCRDIAMEKSLNPRPNDLGRKSHWRLYDYSGIFPSSLIHSEDKKINELKPYAKIIAWNTPFWNCYSTELMQRWDKLKLKTTGKKLPDSNGMIAKLAELYKLPLDITTRAIDFDNERLTRKEVWAIIGNNGHSEKIGTMYAGIGVVTVSSTGGNRDYLFPEKKELYRNIAELLIEKEVLSLNG